MGMIGAKKYSGWKYELINFKGDELLEELNKLERCDVIDRLQWNYRNGVYTDDLSLEEFGRIVSKEEGIEIVQRQIENW